MRYPSRFLTLCALLIPWLILCRHLGVFWSLSPEYSYGWLVPPLALYLFFRRWNTAPASSNPGARGAGWVVLACVLLLPPIWLVRTATPDWSVIGFCLTGVVTGLTLASIACMRGWRFARHMAFPVLFIFCAVPWPQRMETSIIQSLMRVMAALTAELMQWCGIAAVQRGNLVDMGGTTIGIAEACSGVRSIQSMLMAALFLGELRRMPVKSRVILVVAGFTLALFFNLVRNTTLAWVAHRYGAAAFEWWHDPAGWSILAASFICLLGVAKYLGKPARVVTLEALPQSQPGNPLPIWMSGALLSWCLLILAGNEIWYRSHEQHAANPKRMEIHWPVESAQFHRSPISDRARDLTLCSAAWSASWLEPDGRRWMLTSLRWEPGRTAALSARIHQPDVCLQASGAMPISELPPVTLPVAGGTMTFRSWLFVMSGRSLFVFYNLREEANRDQLNTALQQDWSPWSRMQRAFIGQRNLGQQNLEIALEGYDSPDKAAQALQTRLPELVSIVKQ